MLVGIHQLHYLPWLRYIEKIARCDVFVMLDSIQYNKNGWQNRNKIKTPQGTGLLTVPVLAKEGQRLDEVQIDNTQFWAKKHWRSIEQSYSKAAYFSEYEASLSEIYTRSWDKLNDLNRCMLEFYLKVLGISTPVHYSSELKVPGEATERLVNLIKAVDGTEYYSGAFALESYLDADLLAQSDISLRLQEWTTPHYSQLHGTFIPDLAVMDILMNCGPESLEIIMGNTE